MLVMDPAKSQRSSQVVINKSKFIGLMKTCHDVDDVKKYISELWTKAFKDASHIVYALRVISTNNQVEASFSDDGEPSGTAGRPILNLREGRSILNSAVIVVRYYGGINLGTGGLVKAYSGAAKEVIEKTNFIDYVEFKKYKIYLKYNNLESFINLIYRLNGQILERNFEENINFIFKIPKDKIDQLKLFIAPNELELHDA